jgi:CRP-like cAMP-binding protein
VGRDARSERAWIDRLRSAWLLSDCSADEIRLIGSLCTPIDVRAGRVLLRQGEHRAQFFISVGGTAAVAVDEHLVALIEHGSCFGEAALAGGGAPRATVTAATPMDLLVFSQAECWTLAQAPIPSMHAKIDLVRAEREQALAELAQLTRLAQLAEPSALAPSSTGTTVAIGPG